MLGLEAPFVVGTAGVTYEVADADDAASLFAIVDAITGAVAVGAFADNGGTLRVCFSDGFFVIAEPDPKTEACISKAPTE